MKMFDNNGCWKSLMKILVEKGSMKMLNEISNEYAQWNLLITMVDEHAGSKC